MTRFESGPLSQILDDPAVTRASEKFVRVIIRRPQAYEFRKKYRNVPVPGMLFLDAQGKLIGMDSLESAKNLVDRMHALTK